MGPTTVKTGTRRVHNKTPGAGFAKRQCHEEYNAALARKNSARKPNDVSRVPKPNDVSRVPTISSWKDDPSERARRIWIWWRSRLQAKSILPSFRKAARLVVLVPPSSAAA
jgi:hypothetical protein